MKMETDPVSETLFSSYLEFQTMDEATNPVILSVIHHRLNPVFSHFELFNVIPYVI
jgi:hypothetical protein